MNYFQELLDINIKYTGARDNLRYDNIDYYNNLLEDFYATNFDLIKFLRICTLFFNAQIFTDGNSRTIFEYMRKVLREHGYNIDRYRIKQEKKGLREFFPIMNDLNEKLTDNEIQRMLRYIHKDSIYENDTKHKSR